MSKSFHKYTTLTMDPKRAVATNMIRYDIGDKYDTPGKAFITYLIFFIYIMYLGFVCIHENESENWN